MAVIDRHPSGEYKEHNPTPLSDSDHEGDPHKHRWLIATIAASAVATVAMVGGNVLGKGGEQTATEPPIGTEPSHSAPVTPSPSEVQSPSPEATNNTAPKTTGEISLATYDFRVKGQEYKGVKALEDEFAVTVDEAPTAREAARKMIDLLNTQLSADLTEQKDKKYAQITTEDGQWAGLAALSQEVVVPSFNSFIYADKNRSEGSDPTPLKIMMDELREQQVSWWSLSMNEPAPYYGQFELPKPEEINVLHDEEDIVEVATDLTFTDNSHLNSMQERRELSPGEKYQDTIKNMRIGLVKEVGRNGKMQWRITGAYVPAQNN